MGMGEYTTQRKEYEQRVQHVLQAVKELEECALDFPETRDQTLELLENYSGKSKESGRIMRSAAQEVAAIGMLEILHE